MSLIDTMREELIDKLYNIEHATGLSTTEKVKRIQHAS